MADTLLHAELLAACSSLGYSDGKKYHKEADYLETAKDLVRYLRKDDEGHEIRRALGETRVVQTDLLPLIRDHGQEAELFEVVVRLLVDLTNPALLLFREELPEEKVTRQQFLQLVTQQQGYKEAFVEEEVWVVLVGRLGELLQLDWEHRREEDGLLLERILVLIRNVLSVPASPEDEKRTDDDASVHDQVLWALHLAGLEDLLLYVASSEDEQDLCMHVVEIVSLMLREQDASQLARAGLQRSRSEKEEDERELLEIRQRETLVRQERKWKYYSARHSRFGGSYYVRDVKGIGDRDLVSHRPLTDVRSLDFDYAKRPKKHQKNRVPMCDGSSTRRSTLAIRLFLQEFCVEFLNGAYNSIMYIVKDNLNRAKAQEHDESYYLWAIKFFMEFNRHHQFKIELVSETLSIQMFHYIQTNLEHYYEMMTTDKKKIPLWSRRMHKAVRAYQELLMTLLCMDKSENESVRESSKVMKSKIFYVVEYREMVLVLLQNYDPLKMTITYLKDVVETTHIFLKLLEGLCGKNKHLMVQRKGKKAHKKKATPKPVMRDDLTEDKLQDLWDELSSELSAVVQGEAGELPATIPFDTLSEQSEEEQKEVAMRRINKLLRSRELTEAVSLMRSSREVWPEGNVFGSQGMDHSEEFLSLREIFMANLNPVEEAPASEHDDEEEFEEEEESMMYISEQEFDFLQFVRRFANTKVMQSYARLFKQYQSNSTYTNHCILKMYHRIAWDCKLPAMFFQASLFCVFQQAMEDPGRSSNESVKGIVKFALYIFRQFIKVAKDNSKVFMELLFWKTNKEALEIEVGYDDQASSKQTTKQTWREEEEDELRRLFEEFDKIPVNERGEKDTADLIMENIINQNRSRRMVIKKLKEMGLIRDTKELKHKTSKVHVPQIWSEDEEQELRKLFEENKDAMDIVGRILDNMAVRRPKHRVVEKILELGLVMDRKELRKKRTKKPKDWVSASHLGERVVAANQSNDEDTGDSGSDGDKSDDERNYSISDKRVSNKKSSRQAACALPVATPALISQALKAIIEANMQEPVEWISRILKEVADDREEDGDFEPVPVLALTESCTDALEDEKFQKLLKLVGLKPPQSHQEMFWRIPSQLSVVALRKRAHYLVQGISGNIEVDDADEPLESVEPKEKVAQKKSTQMKPKPSTWKSNSETLSMYDQDMVNVSSEDEEDCNPELASLVNADDIVSAASRKSQIVVDDSSNEDVPLSSLTSSNPKKHYSKKRIIDGSEESDEKSTKSSAIRKFKKKRRIVMSDDSGDDTPEVETHDLVLHLDTEMDEQTNDHFTTDDGDQITNIKEVPARRRMLDSDDDDDDVPLISGRQRALAIIDSDDD